MDNQLAQKGFTEQTIAYRIYWLIQNGYEVTKQNAMNENLLTRPEFHDQTHIPPELEKALLNSGRDDGTSVKGADPNYKTLTKAQIGSLLNGQ